METVREQPARLNVLLTEDLPREEEYWTGQLSRLLRPLGVAAYIARSGAEAMHVAETITIHAAVIDLHTPRGEVSGLTGNTTGEAGLWLLNLMRRLPNSPPVVVLRRPAANAAEVNRLLSETLELGVFSVLVKPVGVHDLLAQFRRLIDRRYHGAWPGDPPPAGDPGTHRGRN